MSDNDKVNILLVDDQPQRLLSYEAILAELGQNIVKAHSGSEALQLLMREEFAVILLDVNMPELDGFETATMIHQHPRYEETPIIFVTAFHVSDMDRLKGYEIGAVDYVYVPVIPKILRSKVAVLVELYSKRRELARLNQRLERANAELAEKNSSLQEEKTRVLESLNATLARANSELKAEIGERVRLENALKDADKRKDEFIAMLAHELRNPLAPIVNGLELMRLKRIEDPELVWSREVISRQVKHLSHLVEDLLDVSRITQGKIKLKRERLEIAPLVARAIETTRPLFEASHHRLSVSVPGEPLYVDGDATRLTQALGNVLSNAAKYTPDGGEISIVVTRDDATVEVRVTDSGIGIPAEMLPRLFELFSQVESATDRAQGGLGIGLALVRRLVELHGGRVHAHSEGPGRGSDFVLRLPLALALPKIELLTAGSPGSAAAAAPPKHRRILIVDDNRDSADSWAMILRCEGHAVQAVNSGLEALGRGAEWTPDVVLLDLGMPGMDGYETARRIRETGWGKDAALVALTGWSQSDVRERTRRLGFSAHLIKPIERTALLQVLATLPVPSGLPTSLPTA